MRLTKTNKINMTFFNNHTWIKIPRQYQREASHRKPDGFLCFYGDEERIWAFDRLCERNLRPYCQNMGKTATYCVGTMRSTYKDSIAIVRVDGNMSPWFLV